MKERVKVMQDVYENRSTNKKAAGCTVIISGEMKEVMDKIIAKHPEYKSYAQAFAGVVERGIRAIVGGIASFHGMPVTVIGQEKGKNTKENIKRNFGMPSPDGYRKALRLMKQAETFGRPVVCFVDTPGAFCGLEAEERGQGEAIARNLYEMSGLKVPVLCIMIGEGGSGGALALSVGNEVWMLENATYSILSPEGFASILWKDGRRAKEASGVMKITAQDLKALGVIEEIIPEYGMADQPALISISRYMKRHIKTFLKKQNGKTGDQLAAERYQRFRVF